MGNNGKQWSGRSRGGGFGYNFFILLMKVAGIRSAYAFLSLVVVYFIPFAPRATRAVWFYNRRILGYGRLHSAVKLYAHYYALGQTIIDRVAIGSGMERKYKFEFENYDAFLRVLDGGRGAVIIGAHVGCWGTGAGFFGDYAHKMHLVMYDAEYRQIKNVMEKHCGQEGYKVIAVNEGGIESILRIKEVLDRKEYVCFQGDRFVEGSPTVTVPFMGHEAPFPAGPFAVAGKFRAPVVFYYAMRERGRRYRFIFDIPDGDGCGTKEAILGSYVRSLEAVVRRYPQQWFNFYRFWS
jgi:predicted LPLAT superfamily acyltransferase